MLLPRTDEVPVIQKRPDADGDHDTDPADRPEPSLEAAADAAGVPPEKRAHNAGGAMSETSRSRSPDANDDEGQHRR